MDYKKRRDKWKERAEKIVWLHDEDERSFEYIGRKFCISRQRAFQIYQGEVSK